MKTIASALILAIVANVCAGQPISSSYSEIRRLRAIEKRGALSQTDRKRLGLAYHAAGQHLLFRRTMLAAIEADPRDAEPWFFLGRHYASDVSDWAKAAGQFRAAVDRKPAPEYQAYLGHALEMLGRKDESLALYRKAIAAQPCETVSLAGLMRLEAIGLDPVLRCKSTHPVVLRELAKQLTAAGRHAEAARALERVLDQEPANTSAAYQLHRAWRAAGDAAKADASLERYKRLNAIYGSQ